MRKEYSKNSVFIYFSIFLISSIYLLFVPLSKNVEASEGTLVKYDIKEDTTWTKEGSPYYFENYLVGISPDATLTIEPGVKVIGRQGIWFDAEGKLVAIGTPNERITFEKLYIRAGGPNQLVHIEYADYTGFGGFLITTGKGEVRLSHNTFSNGTLYLGSSLAGITIDHNLFDNNGYLSANCGNGKTVIKNNTFLQNKFSDINLYNGNSDCHADSITLSNNNFFLNDNFKVQSNSSHDFVLDAKNNYWGTTDIGFIERLTYKGVLRRNLLNVEPFATKPFDNGYPFGPLAPPIVDDLGDNSEYLNGKTDADSIVLVLKNDKQISEGVSSSNGQFTVSIPVQKAGTVLKVHAVDSYERTSSEKEITVVDVTPPEAPKVNSLTDQSTEITGTSEPLSNVTVKEGKTVIGTVKADEDGYFSLPLHKPKTAGNVIEVQAQDSAGNVSEVVRLVVLDITPPAQPELITKEINDQTTKIEGYAEPRSKVVLKSGSKIIYSDTMFANILTGYFSFSDLYLKAGEIEITATDAAGNESEPVKIVVKDITPPEKPTLLEALDNNLFISGYAEPGATVEVFIAGTKIGTKAADPDGFFKIGTPNQKAGTKIEVVAIDAAGNISESAYTTILDVTPPAPPQINGVTDQMEVVSGKAEPFSTVQVKYGNTLLSSIQTDKNGVFTLKLPKQKAGTILEFLAIDEAGNISKSSKVQVKDVTPPPVPQVNNVTNKSAVVTGKAENDATIIVTISGKKYNGTADKSGNFKIAIPVQNIGVTISVSAKDKSGNTSAPRIIKVVRAAPNIPTVSALNNKSTVITGNTEKNIMVYVKIGSKTYSSKADINGKFKVTIPVQNAGVSISVTVKDGKGNLSVERIIKVVRAAPDIPIVNTVNNKSTAVTGKTEKNIMVYVKIGSKTYSSKSDNKGNFKVIIPIQNAGVKVAVTAKDGNGKISASKNLSVVRVAPNIPIVNSITNKSTAVTGKTGKGAIVTVVIGKKAYKTKANSKGSFKVVIPKQKSKTLLNVSAKDSKGNVSAVRKVNVK